MNVKKTTQGNSAGVAIISGGGTGIGRATACSLAAWGMTVLVTGRRKDVLECCVSEIRQQGGTAKAYRIDVTDELSIQKVFDFVLHTFGRIDVLVNNAAVPGEGIMLHETNDALWEEIVFTNLTGPFRLSRAVLPIFIRQRSGVIINLSSIAARKPLPLAAAYNASKAALTALTKSIALDYGPYNIRCNAVLPGTVHTPMTEEFLPTEITPNRLGIPLNHIASPKDIAQVVTFLCSDAARHISGETITVDGGQMLTWL